LLKRAATTFRLEKKKKKGLDLKVPRHEIWGPFIIIFIMYIIQSLVRVTEIRSYRENLLIWSSFSYHIEVIFLRAGKTKNKVLIWIFECMRMMSNRVGRNTISELENEQSKNMF
jgi:hypothetical protein